MPAIQTTYKTTTVVEPKYEGGYPLASEFYTYYPTWFNGKPVSPVGPTTTIIPTTTTTIVEPITTSGQFEDVVIGGVSGRFPESDNVEEFAQNLYNGVDMVTEGERRWPSGLYGLPKRNGTIKDISRFDAQFFGIHPKQVDNMDPQLRILLEVAYESIFDAGFNPTELRGTRTGVFVGASGSEALHAFSADAEQLSGYSMTGCATSMLANRLSYFFDFKGPSYAIDTACSSSLVALDAAINALKTGQCDYAIVGGVNILAKPQTSLQFQRLGMLSQDGTCKSFDANGKGYVRSETVGAIFLQKKSACRRFYAKILHSKINTDGAKEQGITFPSGEMQARLLREIYAESDIDPALVTYVEAHGTGTKAGDPQELNTIADIFAGQRVQRSVPLFIGSTKSNMGHPEPASGIAALVKMFISIQRGVIPANLHYQEPNKEVAALLDGRLKVVNEHTRFRGGLMALNSFGFGGANAHILLQPNSEYIMGRLGASSFWNQDISEYVTMPRLFPFCARTQEGLEEIFQHVHQNKHDLAAQFLMHPNSTWPVTTHPYRGYTIINGQQQVQEIRQVVPTTTTTTTVGQKPVWFIFSGMGTQWHGMGQELMKVDTFRQSIIKSSEFLKPYGLNLWEVIHSKVPTVYERTLNSFVGIAAVQIALVDCLKHVGVVPEGIVGHSVGELGCAYADGCFTHEETILAAYHRGRCIEEAKLPPGAMAAVGLTWAECQRRCPGGVVPACHNSHETVTISGPKTEVMEFVEQLTREGIFAKLVDTNDVAFHSYFMNSIALKLKQALDTVIRTPRQRTGRWISTSIPESRWETELARFSSPEYHVNNLCSPVLFQEALKFVPTNAVVVEIAPHALLQAVLRRSLTPTVTLVPLMKKDVVHHLEHFLTQFGRMYMEGVNVDAVKLLVPYGREHTIYPVPHTTGFLSHLVKWDHQQQWNVPSYKNFTMTAGTTTVGDEFTTGANVYKYTIDVNSALEDTYLTGHQIDGRIIYPATGYLHLVWKTFAKMNGYHVIEQFPIGFENVEIHRATILAVRDQKQTIMPKKIVFGVSITPTNGFFEVIEAGSVVVTGRVFIPEQPIMNFGQTTPCQWIDRQRTDLMVQDEIYRELRLRGYEYQREFQPIIKADIEGSTGELIWNGKWISFMDGMLQMSVLGQKRGLLLPTRIRSIRIDPIQHFKTLVKPFHVEDYGVKTMNKYWYEQARQFVPTSTMTTPYIVEEVTGVQVPVQQQHYVLPVVFDPFTNTTVAGGIEIVGLHATSAPRRQFFQPTVVERVNFVPYVEKHFDDDYLFVDTYEKENGEHEPIIIQNVEEPTVKQQREFYEFYLNECKRYVQFIVKKLENHTVQWTGAQMPTTYVTIQPTQVPVAFQPFVEIMKTGGKLLSLLQQIATIECETGVPVTTFFYKVQKVFTEGHAYWNALEQDLVLNYLNKRSYYLKSFLDTVLENVNTADFAKQPRLKVLEISPSFTNFMGVKVNNFVKTHPQLNSLDYHYAPTIMGQVDFMGQQQPEDFFTQINQQVPFPIQRVDWNFGIRQPTGHNATKVVITEPPTHLKDFDLVIFNGALSTLLPHFEGEHEMKMWLKTVAERIMKPTGFMFVHEYTNSFDIVNSLNYLEQIVLRQQPLMPVMPVMPAVHHMSVGHNQIFPVFKYQTEPQWCKMIEDAGFYPVALKSDSALSTMILYRVPSLYQTMKTIYPVMQTTGTPVTFEEKILIDDMDQFTWVEKVKCAMANRQLERIWLISEKQPNSGIVGMVNCLRREIGGDRIRCIFIADKKPIICSGQFIPSFYEHHLQTTTAKTHVVQWTQMFDRIRKADLIMNVFRNGKWGSYRHVFDGPQMEQHIFENERALFENCFQQQQLYKPTTVVPGCQPWGTPLRNAYINMLNRGDLSTLSWLQSPEPVITGETTGKIVCQVSFGALNFRDIMLATGKLTPEAIPGYWKMQDGLLGMEFSGIARDNRQKRYMGMVPAKGLATTVVVDPKYVWEVPREWTLEQAATVPVAYSTAYYALVVRGGLRRGDSVLIHAGSGAVGQAAIAIALSYDCEVFVTVSSNEKRDFLKALFPGKLTDECFANSRDIFFEKHVMQMTQGRGVDVVLNSLAEDKLQASVRVLAQHGRFLEIGKFDLNKNSQLGMSVFLKNVSFHGILVDSLFETENHGDWKVVYQLVEEGIRTGVVRPLNSTVFERHQIEDAFRFMAQGKHIGKVLVKVWEPTEFFEQVPTVTGYPRVWFSPMKTYIITGGLGGFGLELTQWIVERGARRVILTSRSGVRTGYQARKLRTLQEEFGCQIQVSSFDVKEEGECILLIKEAIQMCPEKKIGGIFHLAAILEDGIFENQTADRFKRVTDVKYLGSYNLDKYTRSIEGCMDDAAYFVVFSSVSCGRGNAGQTNYGYANSAMERICEYRRRDGKHALAIQWGAIGDVGLIAENDIVVGGTVPQKIVSCLKTLEHLMLKSTETMRDTAIWSTFVPAERIAVQPITGLINTPTKNLVEIIANIIGIKDVRQIRNEQMTLGELGLDSLMGVEIKQVLEQMFNMQLTVREVQQMTFEKLRTIQQQTTMTTTTTTVPTTMGGGVFTGEPITQYKQTTTTTTGVYGQTTKKFNYLMPTRIVERLNAVEFGQQQVPVVVIHPIEGHVNMLKSWAKHMKYPVFGVQYTEDAMKCETIEQLADFYWQHIEKELLVQTPRVHLCGYSFGSSVAFEMAAKRANRVASLCLLDGSHSYVTAHVNTYKNKYQLEKLNETEAEALFTFAQQYAPIMSRVQFIDELLSMPTFDHRVKYTVNQLLTKSQFQFEPVDLEQSARSFVKKLFMSYKYQPMQPLRLNEILLIKSGQRSNLVQTSLGEDYGLGQVFNGKVKIQVVDGDHRSFLEANNGFQVASILNEYLLCCF